MFTCGFIDKQNYLVNLRQSETEVLPIRQQQPKLEQVSKSKSGSHTVGEGLGDVTELVLIGRLARDGLHAVLRDVTELVVIDSALQTSPHQRSGYTGCTASSTSFSTICGNTERNSSMSCWLLQRCTVLPQMRSPGRQHPVWLTH